MFVQYPSRNTKIEISKKYKKCFYFTLGVGNWPRSLQFSLLMFYVLIEKDREYLKQQADCSEYKRKTNISRRDCSLEFLSVVFTFLYQTNRKRVTELLAAGHVKNDTGKVLSISLKL